MSKNNNNGNSKNTGGGTETSFQNTPQAKDDNFGTPQNGALNYVNTTYFLDVMTNDLGGNAKHLWSVDDGNNDSGAMSGHEAGDLLTQDAAGVLGVASNRSQFGASLSVTADGKVAYDTSTMDADHAADLTALALGETLQDSFIYAIRLASGTLSWGKANVVLTGVNDAPTLAAGTLAASEDGGAVNLDLSTLGDDVDSDDDGTSLTYSLLSSPADGSASISGSTLNFDPGSDFQSLAAGETQSFELQVKATDQHGATATNSVTVTVTGVNDDPTLASGALSATEDGSSVSVDLSALGADVDSDDDGSTLTYSILNAPAGGSASINGTTLNFAPGSDFQSLATGETQSFDLEIQATDRHGATATSIVTVTLTGVNDAPTLAAGALTATENDIAVLLDLAALGDDVDSDDDGTSLSYTLLNAPTGGAASIAVSGTTLKFSPLGDFQSLAAGQNQSLELEVQATDEHGASVTNTVTVTITGLNDDPTLASGALNTNEDSAGVTLDLSALGADIDSDDDGSTLTYELLNAPSGGSASISGTTLTFSPDEDFQLMAAGETQSFDLEVQATDQHGATTTNIVTVTLTGVNDAPTVAAGAVATGEDDTAVLLDLDSLGDDLDNDDDGASLSYSLLNAPAGGAASIAPDGTTLKFSPLNDFQSLAAGETQSFGLEVQATDQHGATASNTVTVTVTGANDAPLIQAGSDSAGAVTALPAVAPFTVEQYTGFSSTSLATLQAYANSHPASHTVTTNVIDYTDDPAGFAGEISGSSPWPAAQANGATGTAHPLNDGFFARISGQLVVDTADTYTFRTFNDDGVFVLVDGTLVISDSGIHPEQAYEGSIALAPGAHAIELYFFEYGGEASLEFSYRNSTTTSFGLVDLNPLLQDSGTILFNDVDLTDAHVSSVTPSGAALGTLTATVTNDTTGSGSGGQVEWNYEVENNAVQHLGEGVTLTESFTVSVLDGNGGVAQQQVDVTTTGVNDSAQLGNGVATVTESDAQQTTSGIIGITDADDGEAFFNTQSNSAGDYGSFSIDAAGQWSFTTDGALDSLTEGEIVTDVFDVTSVDGTATTVSVTIIGTEDGPTGVDDSNSLAASSDNSANDNTVYWVDWTSASFVSQAPSRNAIYNVQGTITLPDRTVDVTYTGQLSMMQLNSGIDYYVSGDGGSWNAEGTGVYTSPEVANGPTNNDILQFHHADSARTLTFSEPVENLFFAIVSMNANGYLFDQDFEIVSSADGPADRGHFGFAYTYTKTTSGDGRYGIATPALGMNEFHGVLAIENAVESLTWTGQSDEFWNGFTIGTYGVAQTATTSGNVLDNDEMDGMAVMEVSAVNGTAMVGNSVTLTLASGAILKVDRDGDYFYDDNGQFSALAAGQSHVDSVVYTVLDDQGYTDTATLTIIVDGVNDAPEAANDAFTIQEDGILTLGASQLLGNDSDIDTGDILSLVSVQGAVNGSVSLVGNTIAFQPVTNYAGGASFSYTVRDAAGETSTATVDVSVNPVPDTYVLSNLVQNGSFEFLMSNWTVAPNDVDRVTNFGWQSADRNFSIDLNGFNPGGITQTLNTPAPATYEVSFMLSKNPGSSSAPNPSATVRVSAGDYSQDHTFNAANSSGNMLWQQKTFSFTATSTSTDINFLSLTPGSPSSNSAINAQGVALDEIVVVSNRVIDNFDPGAGGDVLNLRDLLSSIDAPDDSSAFSAGFVRFGANNGNTVVQIDPNGGGDHYLTVATLIGVNPAEIDSSNYLL